MEFQTLAFLLLKSACGAQPDCSLASSHPCPELTPQDPTDDEVGRWAGTFFPVLPHPIKPTEELELQFWVWQASRPEHSRLPSGRWQITPAGPAGPEKGWKEIVLLLQGGEGPRVFLLIPSCRGGFTVSLFGQQGGAASLASVFLKLWGWLSRGSWPWPGPGAHGVS